MKSLTDCYICIAVFALFIGLSSAASAENTPQVVDDGTSFADFVQQNAPEAENTPSSKEDEDSGWWGSNIASKIASKTLSAVQNDKPAVAKRSNASVFDIAGVMLRMDKEQVIEALQKRGYKKISEHLEIPNFIRWRYEEQCRHQDIIGYERIANCVFLMARKNNHQYVQQMKFSNFHTKETMDIQLTSNFTGNKAYRILYISEAADIKGSGAKADYLRNLKIFDFWKKINQKYGQPDNKELVMWGLGEKKPSLRAKNGKLLLEDPMLLELDYTRMSREDKKFMNTAIYTF
ncbi:MAG: hypothetical protein J6N49_06330 [Alphaproteobacteria bacterium]|nr:hypothetical protein [Alphaproteobacteria bacterium]